VSNAIIASYQKRAPLATAYIKSVLDAAKKTGKVATKFGRTRSMPELMTAKGHRLHELSKTAWHHHNAGTAAEILKIKQVRVWKAIRERWTPEEVALVIQFHDEIILCAKDELVDEVRAKAIESFERPIPGFLPFKTDARVGQNWLDISK